MYRVVLGSFSSFKSSSTNYTKGVVLFLCLIFSGLIFGQSQPLFKDNKEHATKKIVQTNSNWQKEIKQDIAAIARDIKAGNKSLIFGFLGLCFLYGFLHALGPGHGKFIVSSYFLAHPGRYKSALIMGLSIGVIHVISAIILHVLLVLLSEKILTVKSDEVFKISSRISYAFIMVLGFYFLLRTLFTHSHLQEELKKVTILSIALVPCPAAVILLSFCYALDIYSLAITGSLFLGLGIGLVVGVFGVFGVAVHGRLLKFVNNSIKIGDKIHNVFSLLGNTLIIILAAVFLYIYW